MEGRSCPRDTPLRWSSQRQRGSSTRRCRCPSSQRCLGLLWPQRCRRGSRCTPQRLPNCTSLVHTGTWWRLWTQLGTRSPRCTVHCSLRQFGQGRSQRCHLHTEQSTWGIPSPPRPRTPPRGSRCKQRHPPRCTFPVHIVTWWRSGTRRGKCSPGCRAQCSWPLSAPGPTRSARRCSCCKQRHPRSCTGQAGTRWRWQSPLSRTTPPDTERRWRWWTLQGSSRMPSRGRCN